MRSLPQVDGSISPPPAKLVLLSSTHSTEFQPFIPSKIQTNLLIGPQRTRNTPIPLGEEHLVPSRTRVSLSALKQAQELQTPNQESVFATKHNLLDKNFLTPIPVGEEYLVPSRTMLSLSELKQSQELQTSNKSQSSQHNTTISTRTSSHSCLIFLSHKGTENSSIISGTHSRGRRGPIIKVSLV